MLWEQKYLKYKKKYLELQIGGGKCKSSSGVPIPQEVLKLWGKIEEIEGEYKLVLEKECEFYEIENEFSTKMEIYKNKKYIIDDDLKLYTEIINNISRTTTIESFIDKVLQKYNLETYIGQISKYINHIQLIYNNIQTIKIKHKKFHDMKFELDKFIKLKNILSHMCNDSFDEIILFIHNHKLKLKLNPDTKISDIITEINKIFNGTKYTQITKISNQYNNKPMTGSLFSEYRIIKNIELIDGMIFFL
jgi:hypothetical protein